MNQSSFEQTPVATANRPGRRSLRTATALLAVGWLFAGCIVHEGSEAPPTPLASAAATDAAPSAQQAVATDNALCGQTTLPPSAILDIGHRGTVEFLARSGDRILSQEQGDHTASQRRWILWDAGTGHQLASGIGYLMSNNLRVDLVGSTMFEPVERGFVVRDARDGEERARVTLAPEAYVRGGLAQDGSYVYLAGSKSLRVWDLDGKLLLDRPGRYEAATIFASAGELKISGTVSASIETVRLDGTSVPSSTPYLGTFDAWFLDGRHFATYLAGPPRALIYTAAGELVHQVVITEQPEPPWTGTSRSGGDGEHFWTRPALDDLVRVYRLGQAEPVLSFRGAPRRGDPQRHVPRSIVSAFALRGRGQEDTSTTVRFLDLRRDPPTWIDVEVPSGNVNAASVDDGAWSAATRGGVIFAASSPSAPSQVLGCGTPRALVTDGVNRLAVATADGMVRVFELAADTKVLHTLALPRESASTALGFAAGGRYLLARLGRDARAFPLEAAPRELVWSHGYPFEGEISGAAKAERVATRVCSGDARDVRCGVLVSDLAGHGLWQTPRFLGLVDFGISPDGQKVALHYRRDDTGEVKTVIYDDTQLLGTVNAVFQSWLDAERLLMDRGHIVDTAGQTLAAHGTWSQGGRFRADTAEHFYGESVVYRTSDGEPRWFARRIYPDGVNNAVYASAYLTGMAMLGPRVVVGHEQHVYVQDVP